MKTILPPQSRTERLPAFLRDQIITDHPNPQSDLFPQPRQRALLLPR